MKNLRFALPLLIPTIFLTNCNNQKQWYENPNYIKSLTKDNIGTIQNIVVNKIKHRVRLIGVDEDIDSNDNTIHTTWEFADLLSDENGFSLATFWNDSKDTTVAHTNYLASTLRKNLVGYLGDAPQSTFDWYTIEKNTKEEKDSIYYKSVLDMLPLKLKNSIIAPKKVVNIYDYNDNKWNETIITDPLFLLAYKEISPYADYSEQNTNTYTYYAKSRKNDDPKRVKKQIAYNDMRTIRHPTPVYDSQVYIEKSDTSWHYAGYNKNFTDFGALYWSRSPLPFEVPDQDNGGAFAVGDDGNPNGAFEVSRAAYPISPCFCL